MEASSTGRDGCDDADAASLDFVERAQRRPAVAYMAPDRRPTTGFSHCRSHPETVDAGLVIRRRRARGKCVRRALPCGEVGRERADEPCIHVRAEQQSEQALARHADQDGSPYVATRSSVARSGRQILLFGLAEADAGSSMT